MDRPDRNMLRKKALHTYPASSDPVVASPLSNFTVRFSNRDAADEYVDITQDVDDPVAVEISVPPLNLGPNFAEKASNIRTGPSTPSSAKEHSGPPSPVSSPVVDRVSAFRDNLHTWKDRFTSHKKSTEDDREKLLPSSSESSHSLSHGNGSHSPSLIGKLVKKLEERRGSGPHKDLQTGSVSPTKETVSEAQTPCDAKSIVGHPVKSGSLDNISRTLRESQRIPKAATAMEDILDAASVHAEPAVVINTSPEILLSSSRTCVPCGTLIATDEPSVPYCEIVNAKDSEGRFGGVPVRKPEIKPTESLSFTAMSPMLIVVGILIAVVVVPMPSFMSGLLFGCILTATASVRIWFTVLFPKKQVDMYHVVPGVPSLVTGDSSSRYPSFSSRTRAAERPNVWMNQQVGDFDTATFHVNQTQSVYVSLDGSSLRIRKPKTRVVARRAMFDEELKSDSFTFVENRVYNIKGATVSLVPADIPRKRRWLWRFPIAIKLADPQSIAALVAEVRDYEARKAEKDKERSRDLEKEEIKSGVSEREWNTLYLLPRCDREKEDWYWKLCTATGQNAFPSVRPNLSPNLSTLNLLFHRIFFDCLTEPSWAMVTKRKIQKKLSVISLPYYIEELQITEIDLGKHLPVISDVSKAGVDQRGVWVEMNFEYHGTVQMTLSTKLNLMKLKKDSRDVDQVRWDHNQVDYRSLPLDQDVQMDTLSLGSTDSVGPYRPQPRERGQSDREANLYESDEEDEFDDNASLPPESGGSKIMRYVEKLTESRAFQKFTDVGIVRRAMENVSETDLTLTVVVERLAGRLAVNVPHPPSDKLWYGFVEKPDLHLKAFPKLGVREVTFDQVTNWIEKKLITEFHRLITVPNMDDLSLPVMNSGMDDLEYRLAKLSELILR